MKAKTKAALCLAGNVTLVVWTIICIAHFYTQTQGGFMAVQGSHCFRYFTMDSNILCALSALVAGIFCAKALHTGKLALPPWAHRLVFSGTAALLLTFLTVMVYLGPTLGYALMLGGDGLYMHLLAPILALLLCACEIGKLPKKAFVWGILPMVVYGTVYFCMVLVFKKWPDFYGFSTNSKWYVSVLLMLAMQVGICFGINAIHVKEQKNE